MSFFDKLNQFREGKETESTKEQIQHLESQPVRTENLNSDPLSIKDLWQQAVELHREKLSQTPEETEGQEKEEIVMDPMKTEEPAISFQVEETKPVDFQPIIEPTVSIDQPLLQDEVDSKAADVLEMESPEPVYEIPEPAPVQEVYEEEKMNEPIEMEYFKQEDKIQSLYDISPQALQEDIHHTMNTVYSHLCQQAKEWFGVTLPEKEWKTLEDSKLGQAFRAIKLVHDEQGYIYDHSIQAVEQLLPLLWKGSMEGDYQVPQSWNESPLGYLFRYIQSGTRHQAFDPIDLSKAAALLNWTEKEVIDQYPQLGGVKLDTGYVFSRQKVKEFMLTLKDRTPSLSLENIEEFYRNTKSGLTKLKHIDQLMNEMYDELRYVRELLLSGTDFVQNRMKQNVKMQIEQRLCDLYLKYKEMSEYSFSEMQMNQRRLVGYTVPNVFQTLDQLGGTVINADHLARSLEQSIHIVGEERANLVQLISGLTTNLGQLSMDLEVKSIEQLGLRK